MTVGYNELWRFFIVTGSFRYYRINIFINIFVHHWPICRMWSCCTRWAWRRHCKYFISDCVTFTVDDVIHDLNLDIRTFSVQTWIKQVQKPRRSGWFSHIPSFNMMKIIISQPRRVSCMKHLKSTNEINTLLSSRTIQNLILRSKEQPFSIIWETNIHFVQRYEWSWLRIQIGVGLENPLHRFFKSRINCHALLIQVCTSFYAHLTTSAMYLKKAQ